MNNSLMAVRMAGLCLLFACRSLSAQVKLAPIPAGRWVGASAVSTMPEPTSETVCISDAQSANPLLLIPPAPEGCKVQTEISSPTSFTWTTTCGRLQRNSGSVFWSAKSMQRSIQYGGDVPTSIGDVLTFTGVAECTTPQSDVLDDLAEKRPVAAAAAAAPVVAVAADAPQATVDTVPVLIGAGDIAICEKIVNHTYPAWHTGLLIKNLLPKLPSATVFTTGDNAYMWGTEVDFNGCYDPAWGAFREKTFPTLGNHDTYTKNGAAYYMYFGENAGPRDRGYYSYDRGTWHVVALNSTAITPAQMQWLQDDLDNNHKPCLAAYWHHPLYSSGNHGNDPKDEGRKTKLFWDLLLQHKADVVISGHDHLYERFAPQNSVGQATPGGIREFVVGTGGGDLDQVNQRRPNSEVVIIGSYGVIMFSLHSSAYEWQFLCVTCPEGQGPVLDKSAAPEKCHGVP